MFNQRMMIERKAARSTATAALEWDPEVVAVDVACRVQPLVNRRLNQSEPDNRTASHRVFLKPTVDVRPADRLLVGERVFVVLSIARTAERGRPASAVVREELSEPPA
jgi:hypothetical protein